MLVRTFHVAIVLSLFLACSKPSAHCTAAKEQLLRDIHGAQLDLEAISRDQHTVRSAAISDSSDAKMRDDTLTQTLDQIAQTFGCGAERVCCTTPKPIDKLDEWSRAFLDVDPKPFVEAATALRTATGAARREACVRVNATIEELAHATREKLAKRSAEAAAQEQHVKDALTARDRDQKLLSGWDRAVSSDSVSESGVVSQSDVIKPVQANLARYIAECR